MFGDFIYSSHVAYVEQKCPSSLCALLKEDDKRWRVNLSLASSFQCSVCLILLVVVLHVINAGELEDRSEGVTLVSWVVDSLAC